MNAWRRRKRVWICLGLSLLLVWCDGTQVIATSGKQQTQNEIKKYESSIKKKQNEIADITKERKNLKSGLSDLKKVKQQLEEQKTDLKQYVQTLDHSLETIQKKIETLQTQISDKEGQIQETQRELEEALNQQQDRQDAMVVRMRKMYEKGEYLTDVFWKSADFRDFLNRADFVERVIAYDQRMVEELRQNAEYIALCREQLEAERLCLDEAKAGVEQEQQNVETLIAQKERDIKSYETDINTKSRAIAEYEEMIVQQEAEIQALEQAIAAEKKALAESKNKLLTYDGGTFQFPLATYTRISDDYGMRMHPTLGVEQFHNGVDFASPAGTKIYAAYKGKVVAATYSDTMGNYVMIDHGDSLYTIYMHASALYVSRGDSVDKGTTIAAVGTTGRSTGNHLHFGVRKNGAYVSPWNYLKK